MISEVIRSKIETLLNTNTASKVFRVGSYATLDDEEIDFIYDVKNGYTKIETNFVPCMMKFNAEYKAMPNQITGMATIDTVFMVLAEQQDVMEDEIALVDEVVSKVVGQSYTLTDGSISYNSVWSMTALMPLTLIVMNGKRYLQIQSTIYVSFSDTIYYGNQYGYFLNGTRIYPFSANQSRDNEEFYPHILGDYEAKGDNATSAWTSTQSFYVDSFMSAIVDSFSSGTYDMSTIFLLKETTPTKSAGNEVSVRIKSAAYSTDLGEEVVATLVFFKADTTFVETTYTITYNLNSSTNSLSNPATFIVDDLPITLYDATRTNYIFDGWFDNAEFTGDEVLSITTLGNKTLYAKLTEKVWTASTELAWDLQDEFLRSDITDAPAPATNPGVGTDSYPVGWMVRVSSTLQPTSYFYYIVTI